MRGGAARSYRPGTPLTERTKISPRCNLSYTAPSAKRLRALARHPFEGLYDLPRRGERIISLVAANWRD